MYGSRNPFMKQTEKERRPMRGRVVYIHPRGLFHTVEFQTRGGAVKESFQGVEV